MIARITHYKMKTDSIEAATTLMNDLKPKIMALSGLHSFVNVMKPDGEGYIISMVESQALSDANTDAVAALWNNFASMMEAPPKAETLDVHAHWIA